MIIGIGVRKKRILMIIKSVGIQIFIGWPCFESIYFFINDDTVVTKMHA